jgi:hypothetical protein
VRRGEGLGDGLTVRTYVCWSPVADALYVKTTASLPVAQVDDHAEAETYAVREFSRDSNTSGWTEDCKILLVPLVDFLEVSHSLELE